MLPILFTLQAPWGPQPVYAYGALLGLALLLGLPIVRWFAERQTGHRAQGGSDWVSTGYLIAATSGVLAARLMYVLEHRTSAADSRGWLEIMAGDVAAHAGFAGGVLGSAIYLGWKRRSLLAFADAAAPALALGMVLTRIGCYMYGCDYGKLLDDAAPTWLKELGSFPRWNLDELGLYGSPAFVDHVARYGLDSGASASFPVHPTQLYEAVAGLVLLGVALAAWRVRRFEGQVFLKVAMLYGGARFLLEYLRDDPGGVVSLLGFSTAQLTALAMVPICAVVHVALAAAGRRSR
jgi:phosphatidylglycerol---prolipoprotein diacylglyceryl transferase